MSSLIDEGGIFIWKLTFSSDTALLPQNTAQILHEPTSKMNAPFRKLSTHFAALAVQLPLFGVTLPDPLWLHSLIWQMSMYRRTYETFYCCESFLQCFISQVNVRDRTNVSSSVTAAPCGTRHSHLDSYTGPLCIGTNCRSWGPRIDNNNNHWLVTAFEGRKPEDHTRQINEARCVIGWKCRFSARQKRVKLSV